MKKLLTLCMALVMTIFAIAPISAFATETTEGTELTEGTETTESTEGTEGTTEGVQSNQIIHADMSYEENTTRTAFHYLSDSVTSGAGAWSKATSGNVGEIIDGIDGNAFRYTSSSGYAVYKPSSKWTAGKILISADISYDPFAPAGRETWVMTNDYTKDDGASDTEYIWIAGLEAATGKGACMYSISAASSSSNTKLFESKSVDEVYTVDILIDLDKKTRTWYVNGVEMATNSMGYDGIKAYTPGISQIKFNMTKNLCGIDNFRIIENPDVQYSFKQVGTVTTESEYLTVRFTDSVYLSDTTDFIVQDANGETMATVAEIEQVNGKFYNLKLSNKLEAGSYNLVLNDTSLKSVIADTTSSNTVSEFTVTMERLFFDIDFEGYTTSADALAYYNTFNQYGTFSVANSNDQTKSNTYGFEGDTSMGVTCSSSGTRNLCYTLATPITSGKVIISYDAAFDATKQTSRQQLSYIEDATNGCILTYGINGDVTVIAGAKASGHYSGGETKAYENNKAYRWDTVIDMDEKTIINYCDGVQFNKVTYTSSYLIDGDIQKIYLRFKPALTFFDNYKMTVNVETFGYTASDIASDSNETIINFDDTMVIADGDMVFKDIYGDVITPTSITKITPRKYKVALPDLEEGVYTMTLKDGKTSALGNTPKVEEVTFNVAARPVKEFVATELAIADAEGGATLSANVTNSFDEAKTAVMLIALYNENDEMVECYAEEVPVDKGADAAAKSITMTTTKDLSAYTVKGFIWSVEDSFYPLCDPVTK